MDGREHDRGMRPLQGTVRDGSGCASCIQGGLSCTRGTQHAAARLTSQRREQSGVDRAVPQRRDQEVRAGTRVSPWQVEREDGGVPMTPTPHEAARRDAFEWYEEYQANVECPAD